MHKNLLESRLTNTSKYNRNINQLRQRQQDQPEELINFCQCECKLPKELPAAPPQDIKDKDDKAAAEDLTYIVGMKYPQLVSTRAVNAISDWLVSRLEQLGVEAPQIYTRLLLSLLQSSVQINDPIEFNSLETFIGNRKGGGSLRRYLQCDANTLKKLNAVQCLSEIVSSEQELTTIENLVDELWEKLKDIERQLDYTYDNDKILVDNSGNSVGTKKPTDQLASIENKKFGNNCNNNSKTNHNNSVEKRGAAAAAPAVSGEINTKSESKSIELETDPKKRYFNAFPALSKEMEDSFRIWRRNAKSLTWPADRANKLVTSSSSSSNVGGLNLSTSLDSSGAANSSSKSADNKAHDLNSIKLENISNSSNHQGVVSSNVGGGGGIKRKTKRRKSQSISKGRTMPNARRTAFNDNVINAFSTTGNAGGGNRRAAANRHMSPGQWDTDFDGYWEMGRDLIKEFFAKQSEATKKGNRCSSANGAYSKNQTQNDDLSASSVSASASLEEKILNKSNDEGADIIETSRSPMMPMMPPVDISFCYDDGIDNDEDTYKSIAELTADSSNSLNNSRSSPRRLYQRLVLPENDCDVEPPPSKNDVNSDFIQFKAKFNNNLAALWQNVSSEDDDDEENTTSYDELSLWSSAPTNIPWPTVAPIKENLKSFWTNFYNCQFDLAKIPNDEQNDDEPKKQTPALSYEQQTDRNCGGYSDMDMMNNCSSLPYAGAGAGVSLSSSNLAAANNASHSAFSQFRSMPYNLEEHDINDGAVSDNKMRFQRPDGRRTPIGVFLQDSIWSENLNGGKNTDTDESFYLKVWHSNKKLANLDAIYEKKVIPETPEKLKANDSSFQFSTYGGSKWSEGINAGPNILLQHQDKAKEQQNMMISSDCTDASISTTTSCSSSAHMLSSSGIFSGQTPCLQSSSNVQTNIVNEAKSLSEVYGMAVSPPMMNVDCQNVVAIDNAAIDNEEIISPISLANHSSESSGFVEYSRLKSVSQAHKPENIRQQQRIYQAHVLSSRPSRAAEQQRYPDDENLLQSERTHFQPIRAYADGYTFDVCSSIEVINYKRSDSGYLYFESGKYLEYTRKDMFMAEEESNVAAAAASAAPLYAGSNCDAAISQKRKKERKAEDLVLKFRIMNREIGCQTDDKIIADCMMNSAASAAVHFQHPLYLIFSGASTDGIKLQTTGQACSDAIEALNKAVAAAAKAAAERDQMQLDTPGWLRGSNDIIDSSCNAIGGGGGGSSLIWTSSAQQASSRERETAGVDEIDFSKEPSSSYHFDNSIQQWSLREMGKRCQLNTAGGGVGVGGAGACLVEELDESSNSNLDNNNIIGMQQNNADMHSLWGMCAACNSDYKSAPANNLLRDELKLEADEIMTDLKNMQDLYIGCDTTVQDDSSDDTDCNSDYFWGRHGGNGAKNQLPKNIKHPYPIAISAAQRSDIEDGNEDDGRMMHEFEECQDVRQKETQQKVLQQVNKLIADLMRPEKANDTNVLADAAASAHRELGESLWPDDGEHNIWKQQMEPCGGGGRSASQYDKGNIISSSTRSSRNSVLCAEEKKFLAQLTWEHNNLAEIWTKTTPPLGSTMKLPPPHHQQSLPPEKPPVSLCSSQQRPDVYSDLRNIENDNVASSTKNLLLHDKKDQHKCEKEEEEEQEAMKTIRNESKELCNESTIKPVVLSLSSKNNIPVAAAATTTTTSSTYKRIQQFLNSTGASGNMATTKLKIANRKRRHSASQNYAIFHNNGMGSGGGGGGGGNSICVSHQKSINSKNKNNNNNNNNNIKISDLNNCNIKRSTSTLHTSTANSDAIKCDAIAAAIADDQIITTDDVDMLDDSAAYFLIKNGENMILPPAKQTIITCKYWTTIDPIMDTDVVIDSTTEGTTFSCLVDKNDMILKHVTMLARPLTR